MDEEVNNPTVRITQDVKQDETHSTTTQTDAGDQQHNTDEQHKTNKTDAGDQQHNTNKTDAGDEQHNTLKRS